MAQLTAEQIAAAYNALSPESKRQVRESQTAESKADNAREKARIEKDAGQVLTFARGVRKHVLDNFPADVANGAAFYVSVRKDAGQVRCSVEGITAAGTGSAKYINEDNSTTGAKEASPVRRARKS